MASKPKSKASKKPGGKKTAPVRTTTPKSKQVESDPSRPPVPGSSTPLRFAHPFFTTAPKDKRKEIKGVGKGLAEYPSKAWLLEKIPPPKREPVMTLDQIIGPDGLKQIQNAGSITFHAVGDTGSPDTMTEIISGVMANDYNIATPAVAPAFLFH